MKTTNSRNIIQLAIISNIY